MSAWSFWDLEEADLFATGSLRSDAASPPDGVVVEVPRLVLVAVLMWHLLRYVVRLIVASAARARVRRRPRHRPAVTTLHDLVSAPSAPTGRKRVVPEAP